MAQPTKICFWTTTCQADVLTLVRYLERHPDFEVLVVADDVAGFRQEPIQRLYPFVGRMIDREDSSLWSAIRRFSPDVTIVDNHFPPRRLSPKLFVLWHGFGWKGPNDVREFSQVHKNIRKLTGKSAMKPNENFIWQCFGPTDMKHRNEVSGFDQSNLRSLGSAYTDDLMSPVLSAGQARDAFPQLASFERLVLLAPTWHYGAAFSHWGDDIDILRELLDYLEIRNAGLILRMHDRHRYEPGYLRALESECEARENVLVRYKDRDRDSYLDILASDVMVSNFSSILNYFYATGKPSIHIYPVRSDEEAFLWRTVRHGKVRIVSLPSVRYVWKLSPEENGGLLVRSRQELYASLDQAFADPDCCETTSRDFIETHMAPADGRVCERIARVIHEMVHADMPQNFRPS